MGYEVVDGNINGNIHGIHHQQSEICVSPVSENGVKPIKLPLNGEPGPND